MSQSRENMLRRMVGLGPVPDPSAMRFDAKEAPDGSRFAEFVPEAERALEKERWHREGRRARLAERVAYLPQRIRQGAKALSGGIDDRRAARALGRAQRLRYTSYLIHPIGETLEVEGYLDLGRGRVFPLDVIATAGLEAFAQEAWENGEVLGFSNWAWRPRWIVVPADALTDELIADALARWYRERFEWRRGHWSQVEGRLPEIEVALAWETPERYYAETPFARGGETGGQ